MVSAEVEFLEERLALLETWLESTKDDDNNDDLIEKREEYRGLIEETILLQKKLRKTSKLLSTEKTEKMLQKLSKKQDQYMCEIDEIMNYAETDVLFETAEIEPNELLGEPLETLMEQPGMEGSSSSFRNFSMDDFLPNASKASQLSPSDQVDDTEPVTDSNGIEYASKYNESSATIATDSTSLFTASTANSKTFNYDERTLRKKLKKVEKLLTAGEVLDNNNEPLRLDSTEVRKLRKKRDQYIQALEYKLKNGTPSDAMGGDNQDNCFDPLRISRNDHVEQVNVQADAQEEIDGIIDEEYIEEEIIEEEIEEYEVEEHEEEIDDDGCHDHHVSNVNSNKNSVSYNRKMLKKKLKKVKKMMEATSDPTELEVCKQKKKEYKMALQAIKEQESGLEKSSRSRSSSSSQHEVTESEGTGQIEADDTYTEPSYSTHSCSQSRHKNSPSEVNDDQIELMKKKLRKADKSIEKARRENDPRKLKKMEKKRLEYQNTLNQLLR